MVRYFVKEVKIDVYKRRGTMVEKSDVEYNQCFESWRFFVGLRFTVLGFFLSLTSALVYGVFAIPLFKNPGAIYVLAFIGVLISWAFIMLEGRNRKLYYTCIKRGQDIESSQKEKELKKNCTDSCRSLAKKLNSVPRKIYAWHTGAIFGLYGLTLVIWISLFILTLMKILPLQVANGMESYPCT